MSVGAPDRLVAGFLRFQSKYFREDTATFARLRLTQAPEALVISCCDARVDPTLITGSEPGGLFVIRNVANLVPPYRHEAQAPGIRAALEFAVKILNVPHIVVLGHSGC